MLHWLLRPLPLPSSPGLQCCVSSQWLVRQLSHWLRCFTSAGRPRPRLPLTRQLSSAVFDSVALRPHGNRRLTGDGSRPSRPPRRLSPAQLLRLWTQSRWALGQMPSSSSGKCCFSQLRPQISMITAEAYSWAGRRAEDGPAPQCH